MKKLFIALISLGVCSLVLCLGQISAQETLTITQNHFEFRDEPRVDEATLMGTLRLGTSVEWTGKISGKWFEIKAPNGQIGWVHETGISLPKSMVKPTPVPSTSTSREVSRPSSAQTSKLQAKIKELEDESKEYKNQLEEKDLEITELAAKLENVREQLSDTVKMSEELKQGREEEGQQLIEAQNTLAALQETFKEKETALSTEKVEVTKLQNQLQDLREQRENSLSLERLLLAISIPLNILGLILLGYIGIRHSRQKREEASEIGPEVPQQQTEELLSTQQPFNVQTETAKHPDLTSTESVTVQIAVDPEPGLEELDVVMTSSTSEEFAAVGEEEEPLEEELSEEEVVADVIDMGTEEYGDVEEFEEIIEVVDIEPESEEVILVGDAIESIDEEEGDISDIPVDVLETLEEEDSAPSEEESIGELLEEAEEESVDELLEETGEESIDEFWDEPQEEVFDELAEYDEDILDVEQEEEQLEGLPGESEEIEAEIDLGPEAIDTEEDLEAKAAEELDKHMQELLEDTPAIEQNASLDELLEAGELEEIETTPTEEVTQEVEIEGEKFQRLSESSTQLIEDDQDETFEEEGLRYEDDQDEIEEDVLIGHPGIIEELESIEETPVSRSEVFDEGRDLSEREIQEEIEDDSEQFTSMLEEQDTQVFEAEEEQGEILENRAGEEYEEEMETELVDESVDEELLAEDALEDELEELLEEKALEDELEELLAEEVFDDELEDELLEEDLEDELEELLKEEVIEENEHVSELDAEEMLEESIEEMTKAEEIREEALQAQAAPALLEPSPFLIEPEYESEEPLDDTIAAQEQPPQEAKYDIELTGVGQSKDNVIRLLSKIEGLTGSPQELVENVPCIIARGATEADAQNFQVVMKKFGSEVRLIEK